MCPCPSMQLLYIAQLVPVNTLPAWIRYTFARNRFRIFNFRYDSSPHTIWAGLPPLQLLGHQAKWVCLLQLSLQAYVLQLRSYA